MLKRILRADPGCPPYSKRAKLELRAYPKDRLRNSPYLTPSIPPPGPVCSLFWGGFETRVRQQTLNRIPNSLPGVLF